jgi:hypothetical protein
VTAVSLWSRFAAPVLVLFAKAGAALAKWPLGMC